MYCVNLKFLKYNDSYNSKNLRISGSFIMYGSDP